MKGILSKKQNQWEIEYENIISLFPTTLTEKKTIPLNPIDLEDIESLGQHLMDGAQVEFKVEDFWETGLDGIVKVATLIS